jgi:hypothetical protein
MIMILSAIASLLPSRPRRMRLIKSGPLTNREIEKLDAFLLSDGGLENAMDVSTLDGFLCAVLSGPKVIGSGPHHLMLPTSIKLVMALRD